MRKQGSCLEEEIMQGTVPGARRRGRPRTAWMDNIKTPRGQGKQRTWINGVSTSMVWPYLGSRTAKEQNKTEHLDGEVGGDELVAMTTAAASQTGAREAVLETDVT